MKNFFQPSSVAVIGASKKSGKVGNVILKILLDKYKGKIYPINNKESKILNQKVYPSVLKVKNKIDLAVIAVPAKFVIPVLEQCGQKGIKNAVIISSGFKEIGNNKLEQQLKQTLTKYKIKCVGPNCLGVFDAHSKLDTLFLPENKLKRPKAGDIAFISQSGALASALLDLTASQGYGFSKFISYGNATNLDESDYLEFLNKDKQTKVICLYIEGIKDGKKFLKTCKKVTKPIIVIKGGHTKKTSEATLSHTGSLAGEYQIYKGAFKQANLIQADSLEQMFHIAKLKEFYPKVKGNRIQIITNGGGYGIVTADAIQTEGLQLATLSTKSKAKLTKSFSPLCTISNPIDLVGDADDARYKLAINTCLKDKNNDLLLVILLPQTPLLTKQIINAFPKNPKKPIIVISTGANTKKLKQQFHERKIPVFDFPLEAVKAISKFI
jgi:acetate---CoA ligase (ADP-forming)